MTENAFTKRYASPRRCAAARFHYDWLAAHSPPLRLPRLLSAGHRHLVFEHVGGRHATPVDLEPLAAHLGDAHGATWVRALHAARLDTAYPASDRHTIADFIAPRLAALNTRYRCTTPTHSQATTRTIELLRSAADKPVAIYKDTNPRNILITPASRIVTVDFDDLTLAPFGYDLAKLIVTLAMTHGLVASDTIERALAAYSAAAARHDPRLGYTSYTQLLGYTEVHHVLTARYLGHGGYRYPWPTVRPQAVHGGGP